VSAPGGAKRLKRLVSISLNSYLRQKYTCVVQSRTLSPALAV
jgi:hypothetical protein